MGWFFEDKKVLIPTGKIIAEERPAGSGLSELGKFLAIIAAIWLLGSASTRDHHEQPASPPAVVQTAPADRGR